MHAEQVVDEAPLVQAIRAYGQDVLHDRVRCRSSQCPRCRCAAEGGEFFRRHEARRRSFWVVVGDLVHRALSRLIRWKCPRCRQTFTGYPPFALPHKRYVRPVIFARSRAYVEDDTQSYRQAVQDGGRSIFHPRREDQAVTAESTEEEKRKEQTPILTHTTLHRWITTLGQWPKTMRHAWDLIQQRDPATTRLRDLWRLSVPPWKSRSEARRALLRACRRLFRTEAIYVATFGVSIFPNLATGCGWA